MAVIVVKRKNLGRLRIRPTAGGSPESSPRRPYQVAKLAPCRAGCPNETAVREILTTIQWAEKHHKSYEDACKEAWELLVERNPMPAVLGRVCPHPCESACNRKVKDGALSIRNIERFIGDYGLEQDFALPRTGDVGRAERIAVIGSGPAGLSCAYQLARRGYKITIFEALPMAGGMLRYGIPDYRLPRDVLDKEIDRILKLGVEFRTNTAVGRDIPYEDVKDNFEAIFVGIGAHKSHKLGVPGENAPNCYSGTEFLNTFAQGKPLPVGAKVIVIGGGDTAIDAARVVRRLGSEVHVFYRRTHVEMPAIESEIKGAEEEGVNIEYLITPVEILIDNGKAVGLTCRRVQLGEPDESGRCRPVPVEGSEFPVEATAIIAAVSQEPDFTGLEHLREGRDWIKTDETWKVTDNVYAGGDNINLGLVVDALFHGRMAAAAIHEQFSGETVPPFSRENVIRQDKVLLGYYESKLRNEMTDIPVAERFTDPHREISIGLAKEQFLEEVKRCMSCGMCFECGQCWTYCQDSAVIKPMLPGQRYKFKLEFCRGCDKCTENCPCGYIEMHDPASFVRPVS